MRLQDIPEDIEPRVGDILEIEQGDVCFEVRIIGITADGYLCEQDNVQGAILLEGTALDHSDVNDIMPLVEGLRDPKDNPCWKGYHPVGTKQKNGRTVPNCVPNAKESVEEAGPFSYGAKKPRRGSVADLADKKRREQEKNRPPIEPKDQMVGTAKLTKDVSETSDYFRRREREEAIISGQKPARKKQPAQTSDYARRREQEKKAEKGVAEGSGKNVVKSVKVGNFRHDLVDTGFGWQVRIYNGDELYDTGLSKNSEQKGLAALDDAVAYTKKQLNIKEQGVAEGSGNNITYKQQKGKNKFSVEMLVDGKSAGIFQYDANSGRTIVELDPEYRGQKLGQRLILKGIYTAAMMGLDYAEDESRTQAFDNAMDSLADSGYIVNDNEYWYVTDKGEQFLKQGVAEGSLNEFAPDGFGGDDGDGFDPDIAKMAQEDGIRKGASLADGATLERAMAIEYWHSRDGGMYKQYFAKGFKQGRMNKIKHDNKQYNLNLKLMKDGSIRHSEQGVAEGGWDGTRGWEKRNPLGSDRLPQDPMDRINRMQAQTHELKQRSIERLLKKHPEWERSDLELASLPELIQMLRDDVNEAEYQGRKVPLGKPMKGDVAKSKVYVRKPNGKVVKVNFGDKTMKIKKSNPKRRKSFRARHNCQNPGPRWKARYWSCRAW
jgi:GNAT superfamily N-acetyltransferase